MVRELQGSTCNSKSLDYSIIGFIKKKKTLHSLFQEPLEESLQHSLKKKRFFTT